MTSKRLTTRVLEFLRENPGASIKDLSQFLQISLGMARSILYRLKNNGYIEKAGSGYILTGKGEWLLRRMLAEDTRRVRQAANEPLPGRVVAKTGTPPLETSPPEPKAEEGAMKPGVDAGVLRELMARIENLEERLVRIEEEVKKISRDVRRMKAEAPLVKPDKAGRQRQEGHGTLPEKIMYIEDARSSLGKSFDKLVYEGKIVIVGGLVVDGSFYNEFISKFPLSLRDAEKLSPMEKRLLEEMKREAKVILRAGKRYELIEH